MNLLIAQNLVVLMALTGQHHHIARLCHIDSQFNSLGAVRLNQIIIADSLNALLHLVNNRHWVFKEGIIRSDDGNLANSDGNAPHNRPLAAVAVDTTAKNAD